MMLYREEGVVLRTQKLGEADRIVTIFSRTDGVKRLVAKGVRRTTSKFGATLEPFMVVDFQCFKGRSLDTITQAQLLAPFGAALTVDYERFHSANVVVEAAEKMNDNQASITHYNLLIGALRALANNKIDHAIIRDAFLTRSIALAGWAPELQSCVLCGDSNELVALSIHNGGLVCRNCRPAGSFHVLPETIILLAAYLEGDWTNSLSSTQSAYQQASGFIAAYLQWHLERNLNSLSVSQRSLSSR